MAQVKRRQSDDQAVTKVKRLSLVTSRTGGRQGQKLGRLQYALAMGEECRRLRRGLRARHGRNGIVRNLGGPQLSPHNVGYAGKRYVQKKAKATVGVGLTDSTLSVGKPHTWGSGEQYAHVEGKHEPYTQRREHL